jgi:hypothetical protein
MNHKYFIFITSTEQSPVLNKYGVLVPEEVVKTFVICVMNLVALHKQPKTYLYQTCQGTVTGYVYELLLFTNRQP